MTVGSNILILDENPDKLSEILSMYGYDIDVALNSRIFFEKLSSATSKFDVVLLNDYQFNGWNTLKAIRNNNIFATLPVIILTSRDDENHQVTALRLGADDCLTVPYAVPNLIARIESLLRRVSWQKQDFAGENKFCKNVSSNFKLTQRETEILFMVSEGCSNGDIANKLVLKEVTVKTHLNNIFKKFKVQNRMQAVITAQKLKILK